uniref:Uncharacterized protein n=1 Tax=Globodera rostochiensis TaxID=31243 RepID=A0A914HWQ9_GLORO
MLSCLWPSPSSLNCSRLTQSRVNIDRFWIGAISVLLLLSRLISCNRLVARLEPLDMELRRQVKALGSRLKTSVKRMNKTFFLISSGRLNIDRWKTKTEYSFG